VRKIKPFIYLLKISFTNMAKRISTISLKLRKRIKIYFIALFLLVLLLIFFSEYWLYVGFDVNLEKSIISNLHQSIPTNYPDIVLYIFSNNYYIALNFLIPIIGLYNLIEVMSETSKVFSTISIETSNQLGLNPYFIAAYLILFTIFNPFFYFFGILEFLGYALTISQGTYLVIYFIRSILRRDFSDFKNELIYTVFIIILSAIILLLAAALEALTLV